MRAIQIQLGDVVEAADIVRDGQVLCSRPHGRGHVIEPPDRAGWVNVFFEDTGRVTLCAPEELLVVEPPLADEKDADEDTTEEEGLHV
jgi:hypothetical protein